ncbi:MAG: radical SAM protein [Thermodesulfobacteriota bacterium]
MFFPSSEKFSSFLLSYFWSPRPKVIDIELTNQCNLKCKMCWFHGEGGIGDRYRGSELKRDEVTRFITQLAKYKPRIYLGGSEPFIRDDFLDILEHIKALNLPVSFTTNGTLFDSDKIKEVVKLGIDHVVFSIDGDEALHDEIRGKGVFKKVTSNIKELFELKKEKNCGKPMISVNITITPLIVGHLQESITAIREATRDGVDFYRVHHLWYITEYELGAHQSQVNKYLNCSAPGAVCHLTPLSKNVNRLTLSNEILQLRKIPKIKFFPNLNDKDLLDYYSEYSRVKYRCLAPFYRAVIKPNGDVKFCPDEWIDDYILGNIRDDAFEPIWNSKKAQYFRSAILWHKSFPACKRCSWMYSFR